MDGYLRWSFDNWIREPYKSLLHFAWEAGDTMLIYPDDNKDSENPQIRLTPRWEKMKEGKRDIEKLNYLKGISPELSDSIEELIDSLGRRYGSRNEWGGVYANSQDDKDYIESEVVRMREGLKQISYDALNLVPHKSTVDILINDQNAGTVTGAGQYPDGTEITVKAIAESGYEFVNWTVDGEVVSTAETYTFIVNGKVVLQANFKKVDVNKIALQIAIEAAKNVSLENVVPAVVKEFNEALANAIAINDKANATQDEVDKAFDCLAKVMHMLEFYQGDKKALNDLINKVKELKETEYTAGTWQTIQGALDKAKSVNKDVNAIQVEVDQTYTELVKAFVNLRYKPNKDLLEDLVNKVNGLDAANYTVESWGRVANALENVKATLDNPEATVEEVNNANNVLTKALSGLVAKPVDTSIPVKPSSKVTSKESAVKTGDTTSFVGLLGLGTSLTVLTYFALKVRKE